jgi:hypothetical protein
MPPLHLTVFRRHRPSSATWAVMDILLYYLFAYFHYSKGLSGAVAALCDMDFGFHWYLIGND